MNKKILAGLTGIVVAGAFWACGSGEINEPTMEDTVVQNLFSDLDQQESFKKDAYDRCRKDPTCADRVAAVDVPAQPSSSSETVSNGGGTSAPVIAASSSSANIIINNNPSSSSPVIVDPASSGSEDTPAQPVTGLGSCAPTTATIEKGGNTTWTFKLNTSNPNGVKVIDVTKSGKFDWTFTGAEPGTETVEKKMTSSAVTYANSGSYEASVTVAIGTATETIKCAPLQVNGDPITGCECGTAATSVDFTATPDVAWTVTGCKSAADISYEWDGAAGTDSFTKTFDAATASYAPKLKVKNSDNTAIDVTCPAVKVTEGAEYVLKFENKKQADGRFGNAKYSNADETSEQPNQVPVVVTESGSVVSISGVWEDIYYVPDGVMLICTVEGSGELSLQLSSSGEKTSSQTGNNNVRVEHKMPDLKNFENGKDVSVEFTGAKQAKCELQVYNG